MKIWIVPAALLAVSLPRGLVVARPSLGPPLLCQEFAIGAAQSLPWETGREPKAGYDRSRLAADVGRLLAAEEDLIVRMETLRRAALYAGTDRTLVWELVGRRGLAVLDQAAAGARDATAWFDTGVLVAMFEQLGSHPGCRAGVSEGFAGYAYLLKALESARAGKGGDPAAIEFACALVAHPGMRKGGGSAQDHERHERHVDAARAGAPAGSLLAQNLASFGSRLARRPERRGDQRGGEIR
jgi:hypothetical protein